MRATISPSRRALGVRLAILAALLVGVESLSLACGGPILQYWNQALDGEKDAKFEKLGRYDPGAIRRVVVVSPFVTSERGPIICCSRDASTFAHEFHEVTGAQVRLARLPNGVDPKEIRGLVGRVSGEELASRLGVRDEFDALVFGEVVEHDAFLESVRGYSADITMRAEGFRPDGAPLFRGEARVQYPADQIAEESAKIISLYYAGRRS